MIKLPNPPRLPAKPTLASPTACTSVPLGAVMSTPRWKLGTLMVRTTVVLALPFLAGTRRRQVVTDAPTPRDERRYFTGDSHSSRSYATPSMPTITPGPSGRSSHHAPFTRLPE